MDQDSKNPTRITKKEEPTTNFEQNDTLKTATQTNYHRVSLLLATLPDQPTRLPLRMLINKIKRHLLPSHTRKHSRRDNSTVHLPFITHISTTI